MTHCAVFHISTEEDLAFELDFTGLDLTGKTLAIAVRDKGTGTSRATLSVGSGITISAPNLLRVHYAKASMSSWPKGEYTADLVETDAGRLTRVLPVVIIYNDPGRLACTAGYKQAQVSWSPRQTVVTAYRGATGPRGIQGPANTLTIGTVATVAPGTGNSATITGASPDQVLNLSLERGVDGIGAPTTPDILALTRYSSFVASLRAAGIGADPALFADFIGQTYLGRGKYVGASYTAMLAALSSSFSRSSTATYFDASGVMQTAANNVPRFDHDLATKAARGFLVEQGRTNLYLDSSSWTSATRVSISASPLPAMDGSGYFTRIIPNTSEGEHFLDQNIATTTGAVMTFSVYVRLIPGSAQAQRFGLRIAAGTSMYASFNLLTGAANVQSGSAFGSARIQHVSDGIYRCWVTITATTTAILIYRIQPLSPAGSTVFVGDDASGFDIWGAQVEVGPQPTSYIPTTTAAVARTADGGSSVSLAAIGVNASVWSLVIDATVEGGAGYVDFMQVWASPADLVIFRWGFSGAMAEIITLSTDGNTGTFYPGPTLPTGSRIRIAAAYDGSQVRASVNGSVVSTKTLVAAPVGLTTVRVESGSASSVTKRIRNANMFPTFLTDAQLQALSSLTFGS